GFRDEATRLVDPDGKIAAGRKTPLPFAEQARDLAERLRLGKAGLLEYLDAHGVRIAGLVRSDFRMACQYSRREVRLANLGGVSPRAHASLLPRAVSSCAMLPRNLLQCGWHFHALPGRVPRQLAGLEEALHPQQVVVHLVFRVRPEQPRNGMSHRARNGVVNHLDIDGGRAVGVVL